LNDILQKIAKYKIVEVATAKALLPLAELEARAKDQDPVRGFADRIWNRTKKGDYALIAEIKKASPSKGLIRADFDPEGFAKAFEAGGAACLSVLTDKPSFQGDLAFLAEARAACNLPVLRKDFMLDPYQVPEARLWGADCILIIMAMVDDDTAKSLENAASDWNMDVIIEVHDEAELERALKLRSALVGINNRDLKTFATDLATTERLAPLVPADRIVIAESGLSTPQDLSRMADAHVNAFLIGESLMRQTDVAAATRALLARDANQDAAE
jgi:indole-3-glycerol phosphate synthase